MAREGERSERGGERGERGRGRRREGGDDREQSEIIDKLVAINRVAKVVKGGKNFAFAALVVVGDQKGRVGFGHGKAREVPEAIRKATEEAKKSMVRVPLREGRTLHHDTHGRWGAGKVIMRSAPAGTGVIAGGPMPVAKRGNQLFVKNGHIFVISIELTERVLERTTYKKTAAEEDDSGSFVTLPSTLDAIGALNPQLRDVILQHQSLQK
jgi:hypothetical protein